MQFKKYRQCKLQKEEHQNAENLQNCHQNENIGKTWKTINQIIAQLYLLGWTHRYI